VLESLGDEKRNSSPKASQDYLLMWLNKRQLNVGEAFAGQGLEILVVRIA
jgi:hypothetical protein